MSSLRGGVGGLPGGDRLLFGGGGLLFGGGDGGGGEKFIALKIKFKYVLNIVAHNNFRCGPAFIFN